MDHGGTDGAGQEPAKELGGEVEKVEMLRRGDGMRPARMSSHWICAHQIQYV